MDGGAFSQKGKGSSHNIGYSLSHKLPVKEKFRIPCGSHSILKKLVAANLLFMEVM